MIERAQQQFLFKCKVQQQQKIDFPNNSFDAVFLFAVLTCIIENEAQLFLLKEIKEFKTKRHYLCERFSSQYR